MNKQVLVLIAEFLIAFMCISCTSNVHSTTTQACPSLPQTFQESDLVGTWISEHETFTDTLILRKDRTYRQDYFRKTDSYHFENTGRRWWPEPRANDTLYLHLEGMRRCDSDELCAKGSGGGGDWAYLDFCENQLVEMPNEVILIVMGAKSYKSSPGEIELWHMARTYGSYYFRRQE